MIKDKGGAFIKSGVAFKVVKRQRLEHEGSGQRAPKGRTDVDGTLCLSHVMVLCHVNILTIEFRNPVFPSVSWLI